MKLLLKFGPYLSFNNLLNNKNSKLEKIKKLKKNSKLVYNIRILQILTFWKITEVEIQTIYKIFMRATPKKQCL